jgi:HK97 family phage major capsid protein
MLMASVTLAESAKLSQDLLVAGVIENVITVNPFYDVLPFQSIDGNSLAYNRENALGATEWTGVGDTISAGKAAATFTQITTGLTTLVGDAEVNGLIQATRSNINDQKAAQVASKAKSIGRAYQDKLINGDGSSDTITGLLSLVASGQTKTGATNGSALSYDLLDETIDKVTDKDGEVDYMMMNARTIRSYYALLRALGGAGIGETITLPSGKTVPTYRGIPIFRNDYIPINQTRGSSSACTSIMMGTLDDGSMSHGIAGLTASGNAGISVEEVGTSETKDETITRVKFYNGLANFSEKGLAMLNGINN